MYELNQFAFHASVLFDQQAGVEGLAVLSTVVSQADALFLIDVDSKKAGEIWTAIEILMGLKYERSQIDALLKGVRKMEESVTYQAIVEEGEAKEARRILLKLGTERFGKASARVLAKLKAIEDKAHLEDLVMRTLIASSWTELLK